MVNSQIITSGKMTPKGLARKIGKLRVTAPIIASYERALIARGIWDNHGVWYTSQQEHWIGWLSQYEGPGAYNRKSWKGRSAEFAYNHVRCPPMLLWLAEMAGVSKKNVLAARRSALKAPRNLGSQCAALREAIPWALVESSLLGNFPSSRNAEECFDWAKTAKAERATASPSSTCHSSHTQQ
jgi:hypothetical protein